MVLCETHINSRFSDFDAKGVRRNFHWGGQDVHSTYL